MTQRIAFVMTCCKRDAYLASRNAAILSHLYPDANVLCLRDLEDLKRTKAHGEWTERMFQAALKTQADIIVKLDPDTRPYLPVKDWPTEDVFGEMAPDWVYGGFKEKGVIFGACIGFQRAAVEKILDSGYLRDRSYVWHGESIQDPIVASAIKRLGLSVGRFPNLHIKTRWEPLGLYDKSKTHFAHPVRTP